MLRNQRLILELIVFTGTNQIRDYFTSYIKTFYLAVWLKAWRYGNGRSKDRTNVAITDGAQFRNLYKYRAAANKRDFQRDLDTIAQNCFFAPNFEQLNDPTETLLLSDNFKILTAALVKAFSPNNQKELDKVLEALDGVISRRNEINIYSLSGTYKDELLWAHYSNSHHGFCIEYDFNRLLQKNKVEVLYSFPVEYALQPPEIDFKDLSDKTGISITRKLAGYKSLRWKYEKEYRIITQSFGMYRYNHEAITAIYFGLRTPENQKRQIMDRLKGRGIKYFQVNPIKNSYDFERMSVPDINDEAITYLNQLPKSCERNEPMKFRILEKDFNKYFKRAEVSIELDFSTTTANLHAVADLLKQNLYWDADKLFILFFISSQLTYDVPWAVVNYSENKFDTSFNDNVKFK